MGIVLDILGPVVGKDKQLMSLGGHGTREFVRESADTALHRWIFTCDLSNSHTW
jgi:hypothetical protein